MQEVKHALQEVYGNSDLWHAVIQEAKNIADAVSETYQVPYVIDNQGSIKWATKGDVSLREKCNEMFHELWRESAIISEIYA